MAYRSCQEEPGRTRLNVCATLGLMSVSAIPSKMRTSKDDHLSTKDTAAIRTASTWPLLQHHGPVCRTVGKTATASGRQNRLHLPLEIPVEPLGALPNQGVLPAWNIPRESASPQKATEEPPIEPPLPIALHRFAGS